LLHVRTHGFIFFILKGLQLVATVYSMLKIIVDSQSKNCLFPLINLPANVKNACHLDQTVIYIKNV